MLRATYVEIPVQNMDRAEAFYIAVFGCTTRRTVVDGHPACLLDEAADPDAEGSGIALMAGDSYIPSLDGTRIYVTVDSVPDALHRALANGGVELYPPTLVGDGLTVAEFADSEGNRIALSDR